MNPTPPRTCVTPGGKFSWAVHRPCYRVANLREEDFVGPLGTAEGGKVVENRNNFPGSDVEEAGADPVIEISNPFPFRGTTYILKRSADRFAADPSLIRIPEPPEMSFEKALHRALDGCTGTEGVVERVFASLPRSMKLALAVASTDPDDLVRMARDCCEFVDDPGTGLPLGLRYEADGKTLRITDHGLYEAVANNPCLPDRYKEVMVLRPGIQGSSEIVGDWKDPKTGIRVFEYLRRNSYIPWGHYAANMAHTAIRYRMEDLTLTDVVGMRHLYYQRVYVRLAEMMGLPGPRPRHSLSKEALEALRKKVLERLHSPQAPVLPFTGTLWGWNFGFDYAPNGYRLHASHQQVHQQYALIPASVGPEPELNSKGAPSSYAYGDLLNDFIGLFRDTYGSSFFEAYLAAIRENRRMDGNVSGPRSLVVFEDEHCMVFVPKAQTSQWELQLMTVNPVGNVLEADTETRRSLDRSILIAVKVLGAMGARMISSFECAKRFTSRIAEQRLMYVFLPRLPESPGAFSEAQLRWINGHYPEDFAAASRQHLVPVLQDLKTGV